jgi:hypothetical protein
LRAAGATDVVKFAVPVAPDDATGMVAPAM